MDIKTYLAKHYQPSSVKAYLRDIEQYLATQKAPERARYQDIIRYLNEQRKTQKPASLNRILQSIKKYYNYLLAIGKRTDHPAQSIQIKDEHSKGYAKKLLTAEQLQALWQHVLARKSRYQLLKNRNISMLGLLLYQGLTAGEIKRLRPENIDLQAARVHVPSSPRLNARQLRLEAPQILPLYQYLDQDRPKLLNSPQSSLFINKLGQPESGETLGYLLKTARPQFKPLTFNPKTVRMSVLASKFKAGWSLLQVQYFAGHRYPSSTQRYQQSDLEALENSLATYHLLG